MSTLNNVPKTPRSAREVADKKMRQELRGDTGSKKSGVERDDELAEFDRNKSVDKVEAARLAKQKLMLANPTQRSHEQRRERTQQGTSGGCCSACSKLTRCLHCFSLLLLQSDRLCVRRSQSRRRLVLPDLEGRGPG